MIGADRYIWVFTDSNRQARGSSRHVDYGCFNNSPSAVLLIAEKDIGIALPQGFIAHHLIPCLAPLVRTNYPGVYYRADPSRCCWL